MVRFSYSRPAETDDPEVIRNFTRVATISDMPVDEMCSYCYTTKHQMMQSSQYSFYNNFYKSNFEIVQSTCGITGDTSIPPSLVINEPEPEDSICVSETTYTTAPGDTCTSIALEYSVSSAALYLGNQDLIRDCARVVVGKEICIPLSCQDTYVLQDTDTCRSIERANADKMHDPTTGLAYTLRDINPWIDIYCTNLQETSTAFGRVLCLSPQGGLSNATGYQPSNPNADQSGWGAYMVEPPENATVADGTTRNCGKWHTAADGETCPAICMQEGLTSTLFLAVNPSLNTAACTGSLVPGLTYCTAPLQGWNYSASAV